MEIKYDFEKGTVTLPIATYEKMLANDRLYDATMNTEFYNVCDTISTQAFLPDEYK